MNENQITIIIITYKSDQIISDFIKKIPNNIKTIIIENSENYELKEKIENEYSNIKFYIRENNGVSASLNFAVEKIKTKYFLQISPDIDFNFDDLQIFLKYSEMLNNKFAALGPRFLNVKEKSHKQIKPKLEYGKIESIHGSCMFVNKESFDYIGKFDENFFLYFEETEYCYRAKKKGYFVYQINEVKVESKGRSVNVNKKEEQRLNNLLIWHFIWSKFYFNKKKYGVFLSFLIFIPILVRIIFKITFHKILNNEVIVKKYKFRLDGLLKSMLGKKSSFRP